MSANPHAIGRVPTVRIPTAVPVDSSALLAGVPATLHARLQPVFAAAPVRALVIGDVDDVQKWTLTFEPSATDDQRAAAQALLEAPVIVPIDVPAPVVDVPVIPDPPPLSADDVLGWCAGKFGVSLEDAKQEIAKGPAPAAAPRSVVP